jgi:hypothetical protein
MKDFNDIQNKEDVLFRNVIVGALHYLKDTIYWYNVIDNKRDKVDVPIYFTVAGSERFLSDIFLNSDKLETEGKITGLYNKYPRMHMSLNTIGLQEEDGELRQHNAEFIDATFKMDLSCSIFVDSIIDIYKSIEVIYKKLYKNQYFYVDTVGIKIPCYFNIPPDIEKERLINFGITDKKELKVNFNLELIISYPIFKEETSIFHGDGRMDNLTQNTYIVKNKIQDKDSGGRTDYEVTKDTWPTGNNITPLPNEND